MQSYRTVAYPGVSVASQYMRQVYMWMGAGLLATAGVAVGVASSPNLMAAIFSSSLILILLVVAQFGLVIALSDLTAPVWENIGAALKLPAHPKGLHLFRILRTFIIVNIGWYFDRITDTAEAFRCLARSLTAFSADEFGIAFRNCIISEGGGAFTALGSLGTAAAGTVLVFVFSLLKEKGRDPMDLQRKPLFVYAMLMLVLISFVFTTNAGGFLYANF